GAVLYPPERQGVLVLAIQPRLERRCRQPAEPERPEDGLSLETHLDAEWRCRDPRELRADRRREEREDRKEEADSDFPAVSPTRRRPEAAESRCRVRLWSAIFDPALSWQREVELDCLACASANWPAATGSACVRLDNRRYGSPHPRQADPRHDQAVRTGRCNGRSRRTLERPT